MNLLHYIIYHDNVSIMRQLQSFIYENIHCKLILVK